MSTEEKRPQRRWRGVLGQQSTGSWVGQQLAEEAYRDDMLTGSDTRPVSVRLETQAVVVLDALADRFRLSRSGMLTQLIEGGIADAFRVLSDGEQDKLLAAALAKAKAAGWTVAFEPAPVWVEVDEPTDQEGES